MTSMSAACHIFLLAHPGRPWFLTSIHPFLVCYLGMVRCRLAVQHGHRPPHLPAVPLWQSKLSRPMGRPGAEPHHGQCLRGRRVSSSRRRGDMGAAAGRRQPGVCGVPCCGRADGCDDGPAKQRQAAQVCVCVRVCVCMYVWQSVGCTGEGVRGCWRVYMCGSKQPATVCMCVCACVLACRLTASHERVLRGKQLPCHGHLVARAPQSCRQDHLRPTYITCINHDRRRRCSLLLPQPPQLLSFQHFSAPAE